MKARQEFRDRDPVEVSVLDALADRPEEGMTVFELRSRASVDIDDLEAALANLKEDGLISAEENGDRTVIMVDERVLPDPQDAGQDPSVIEWLRERLPF